MLTYIYYLYYVVAILLVLFFVITCFKKMRYLRDGLVKILKKYRIISILAFSIFMILPTYDLIQPFYVFNNQNPMINEFLNLDIKGFLSGVYTLTTFVLMFWFAVSVAMMHLGFKFHVIISTGSLLLIFGFVLSVIISMLFTFSNEQFNIATTIVSFVALFSFLFSKKFVSNILSTILEYIPKNFEEQIEEKENHNNDK